MKITEGYRVWRLEVEGQRARFYSTQAAAAKVANRWTRHLGAVAPAGLGQAAADPTLRFALDEGRYAK